MAGGPTPLDVNDVDDARALDEVRADLDGIVEEVAAAAREGDVPDLAVWDVATDALIRVATADPVKQIAVSGLMVVMLVRQARTAQAAVGDQVRTLAVHPALWPHLVGWLAQLGHRVAPIPGMDPTVWMHSPDLLEGP